MANGRATYFRRFFPFTYADGNGHTTFDTIGVANEDAAPNFNSDGTGYADQTAVCHTGLYPGAHRYP